MDLDTNYSFKTQKLQRIYIETSPLRFKKRKGFTHKLLA